MQSIIERKKEAVKGVDRTEQVKSCLRYLNLEVDKISNDKLRSLCRGVLDNQAFQEGYGSSSKHHNFPGGLVVHEAEVMDLSMKMADSVVLSVDKDSLRTGIVYHDFGKIWEYHEKDGNIEYTSNKMDIGHLSKSYAKWMMHSEEACLDEKLQDKVGHIILAHHGRKEWGSPVEPNNVEAMIIHYADMLSSRACVDYYVRNDDEN